GAGISARNRVRGSHPRCLAVEVPTFIAPFLLQRRGPTSSAGATDLPKLQTASAFRSQIRMIRGGVPPIQPVQRGERESLLCHNLQVIWPRAAVTKLTPSR